MTRSTSLAICTLISIFPLAVPVLGGELAVPLSPGAERGMSQAGSRCPTFSWTTVDGAAGYEIVVYPLEENKAKARELGRPGSTEPQWRVRLPAGASSWTPSLSQCLEPGAEYAWSVRALGKGDKTSWSEPSLFQIGTQPSVTEVEDALWTLRRYVRQGGAASSDQTSDLAALASAGSVAGKAVASAPPADSAAEAQALTEESAAFRAESDAAVHGVVGISSNSAGGGLVGENTQAGADLVLKGDGSTTFDAGFSETGITFSSPITITPTFDVSALGGVLLTVNTDPVVTTTTDQDTLGGLSCSTNQIAKWNGSAWVCATDATGGNGGGGTSSVAGFDTCFPGMGTACSTVPGPILNVSIVAPGAGTLVATAAAELEGSDEFLDAFCEIRVNTTVVPGSRMNESHDLFTDFDNDCTTAGAMNVASAGTYNVEFALSLDAGIDITDATLWAIWIPAPAAP
jgi:hypothetical protein